MSFERRRAILSARPVAKRVRKGHVARLVWDRAIPEGSLWAKVRIRRSETGTATQASLFTTG